MKPSCRQPTPNGFTLIETIAAVLLTAIVLTVAVRFYLDLSHASNVAAKLTRDERRANSILDRIARDLEASYLYRKPADEDPLNHPWVFLGQRTQAAEEAASRLKFFSRHHRPRGSEVREADLVFLAYFLHPDTEFGHSLLRWSSTRMPESLDREFPARDADGVVVLADHIHSLSFRFLDLDGNWQAEWDSSLMTQAGQLPLVVEIQLTLLPPDTEADASEEIVLGPYSRKVLLPVPPLDFAAILEGRRGRSGRSQVARAGTDTAREDVTQECVTVARCLDLHPDEVGGGAFLSGLSAAQKNACWRDIFPEHPLEGCE